MRITLFFVVVCLITLGAGCGTATNTNTTVSGNSNVANTNTSSAANRTQEDIIYGTNMDPAVVEESRTDCQQRGGTFDECGSACSEGEICITVCALRCDFD